ncbi:Bug family tripartite tricarboxylate transporter substrate binding protein [Bordetella genomosp. 13]|uniref:LacI family transcriptional regulator n=1 Tax=Bordetella genomosp. 13 TaxID=463040 RepID=A0A1W6ZED2_9BORD|nr:tripartite tricarboxylate transporter substrate binding protein [Bordetella genomosp. 13]ARP95679.1 LacI family transcriptional regulator [Bordetella genomosp. 13]
MTYRSTAFNLSRRTAVLGGVTALALAPFASAWAQDAAAGFPKRPVTLVVPYTPGGPTDLTGRIIGEALAKKWGQPVIIENRPGAGGNIGSAMVAKAQPDGYTVVLGVTGSHAINKWLYKNLPYDPQTDFEPIGMAAIYANAIVANPGVPANTLQELVALARKEPAKYAYGSDGNGAASHLSMELVKAQAKIEMTHIPYKGSAPLLNDLLGGTVPVGITGLPSAAPYIQSGKLKLLAITSARDYSGNNYPSIASQGFAGFDTAAFSGIFAPKGTPKAIVDKMSADLAAVLGQDDVKEKMHKLGLEVQPTTSAEFAAFLSRQIAQWREAVQISGAQVD